MKITGYCLASLVGGMVLGTAITLLMTSQKGKEIRHSVEDYLESELDKVRCKCKDGCKCDENGNCICGDESTVNHA